MSLLREIFPLYSNSWILFLECICEASKLKLYKDQFHDWAGSVPGLTVDHTWAHTLPVACVDWYNNQKHTQTDIFQSSRWRVSDADLIACLSRAWFNDEHIDEPLSANYWFGAKWRPPIYR